MMERHGIEWEQKGTHEEHLSVLDFKKQERSKEVAALEAAKQECQTDLTRDAGATGNSADSRRSR